MTAYRRFGRIYSIRFEDRRVSENSHILENINYQNKGACRIGSVGKSKVVCEALCLVSCGKGDAELLLDPCLESGLPRWETGD
jgi:hypothetical protein